MPPGSLPDHSGVIKYGKGIFCPGNNKTQADPLIGGNNAFMAQEGFFGKRFVRYPGEFDEELLKSMEAATGGKYFRAADEHIMGIEYYQAVIADGVRTRTEFNVWRQAHPADGIVIWCP